MIISILFNLLFFLVPLIFLPWTSELFEFNKIITVYIFTSLIVASWIIKMIQERRIIFRRTILDIPLLIFLTSQFLSYLVSIDQLTSLLGYYTRWNGGLLSSLSYSVLYWAYVSNMDRERTVKTVKLLTTSTAIVSVWGILEHFGKSPSCLIITGKFDVACWVQDVQNRVFATFGQPNWLAAWLVAILPITWALAFNSNIKSKNLILWIFLSTIFFLTLLYTKSRSGILGFIIADLIFWIGLFWINLKKKLQQTKVFLKSFLILNFAFLILALASSTPWTPSLKNFLTNHEPSSQVASSAPALETGGLVLRSLDEGGTESGEIRKIVWKGAIEIWKHYPILGTGPETFAYSYYQFRPIEHNLTSEWDFIYNKAHNEFLNYAANTGSLGLLSYLLLIAVILFQLVKKLDVALAAGWASILVTNFFGFSTVPTNLLFFLFPAFATNMHLQSTERTVHRIYNTQKIIIVFILCTVLYALLTIFKYWYSDLLYAKGKSENDQKNYSEADNYLGNAIKLTPDESLFHDEIAQSYLFTDNIDLTLKESELALSLSPRNVSLRRNYVGILLTLAESDRKYLQDALDELEYITHLAPTEPKILYNLGLTYIRTGDIEKGVETLEKSIFLKPNYKNARFAVALLYIELGENQKAKEHLEYILQNIDPKDQIVKEKLYELE